MWQVLLWRIVQTLCSFCSYSFPSGMNPQVLWTFSIWLLFMLMADLRMQAALYHSCFLCSPPAVWDHLKLQIGHFQISFSDFFWLSVKACGISEGFALVGSGSYPLASGRNTRHLDSHSPFVEPSLSDY